MRILVESFILSTKKWTKCFPEKILSIWGENLEISLMWQTRSTFSSTFQADNQLVSSTISSGNRSVQAYKQLVQNHQETSRLKIRIWIAYVSVFILIWGIPLSYKMQLTSEKIPEKKNCWNTKVFFVSNTVLTFSQSKRLLVSQHD